MPSPLNVLAFSAVSGHSLLRLYFIQGSTGYNDSHDAFCLLLNCGQALYLVASGAGYLISPKSMAKKDCNAARWRISSCQVKDKLTVVAAFGHDANSGLPGLEEGSRLMLMYPEDLG